MGNYIFKNHSRDFGFTPVSNIFIDCYMPSANGNFVKVYLSGLTESLNNGSIQSDFLSKKLDLLESDIVKAWDYWESKGLVKLSKNDQEIEIEFLNIVGGMGGSTFKQDLNKFSPEFISSKMEDPTIKEMFDSIQKLLSRMMSPVEISMYLNWIDEYSFSPEVIILIIEYCKSKNKLDSRYIEKVAMGWHDANVVNIEDAQKYISYHETKYNKYRLVLDFLGLKENDLMKPQEELLDKWFNKWNFSLEMILESCKICSLRINEPNFNYIDGILSNWNKQGITNVKDIEKSEINRKTKITKFKAPITTFNSYDQRSYDMKDLEKKLLGRDEGVDDEQ